MVKGSLKGDAHIASVSTWAFLSERARRSRGTSLSFSIS